MKTVIKLGLLSVAFVHAVQTFGSEWPFNGKSVQFHQTAAGKKAADIKSKNEKLIAKLAQYHEFSEEVGYDRAKHEAGRFLRQLISSGCEYPSNHKDFAGKQMWRMAVEREFSSRLNPAVLKVLKKI